ncbi:hypothetical protein PP182_11025 [Maribacter sp. PR1]|uniref:Nucleoside 2-deoxyribosyltransferase n=1 Tax=Maribacter cobaltidurans TaxID=1178778 RepID=A0ABU7IUE9_9FLAO|nr:MULTISPECIES: hypothetical protein [Maribacter]MDC6389215.1 hypothetical protein [Maribacter sp. PR1]MEE1976602.1 hypothetical protein [Maribacter cobaltidurans]
MDKSTKPKQFCFVLMPFTDDFDDIYQLGIKQSCIDAGAYCERVDEQIFTESIMERVYNQISKADFIVADMTDRNPNVFYEVGYAHALGKRTILITQNVEDIPFDLKHYPHIVYGKKIGKLKEDLTARISWFRDNPTDSEKKLDVDIELFLEKNSLANHGVRYAADKSHGPSPLITIFNNSFDIYYPEDYRLGIITDSNYVGLTHGSGTVEGIKTIKLPDGRNLHMCQKMQEILYPKSYTTILLYLSPNTSHKPGPLEGIDYRYQGEQEIIIRVFTPDGYRDFYLTVSYQGFDF